MSKDSSARYYQKNRERLHKRHMINIKHFLKKKKKRGNAVANDVKTKC